jgi:hypothetical protein
MGRHSTMLRFYASLDGSSEKNSTMGSAARARTFAHAWEVSIRSKPVFAST